MPLTFQEKKLVKCADKPGGKNHDALDGMYHEIKTGKEYFVKFPEKKNIIVFHSKLCFPSRVFSLLFYLHDFL